jgi:hypothetical protein
MDDYLIAFMHNQIVGIEIVNPAFFLEFNAGNVG